MSHVFMSYSRRDTAVVEMVVFRYFIRLIFA